MKILIFCFIFLLKKIYSISGTDEETYENNGGGEAYKVNLNEVCPCDKTEGVCDMGCCCDKDCLIFMFDQKYFELFTDCDPSSSFSKNLHSKLDYCDEHKKSVDDLFNPLVLAFKVLKKGFCLANDNSKQKDNNNENYYNNEIKKRESDNTQNEQNDYNGENYQNIENPSFRVNANEFENLNFNVPITLPSGMCLFGHFQIKKFQDYEVTCSYRSNNSDAIISKYNDNANVYNYYIHNNYYYDNQGNENYKIKKIEIIYYNNASQYVINHYYTENNENSGNFYDLTFVVRFLKDLADYPKSGNPGYIKGKPILIKGNLIHENDNNTDWYSIYSIFPLEKESSCIISSPNSSLQQYFYFDNYMDNKLTFEDFTIYGFKNKTCFSQILASNNFKIGDKTFGKFGNSNVNNNDWVEINNELIINSNINQYTILGVYKEAGAVNNTQFQIIEINSERDIVANREGNILYFIIKFTKPKVDTKWWYAPGPGFIKLPKNIMYPFKIGTTTYEN